MRLLLKATIQKILGERKSEAVRPAMNAQHLADGLGDMEHAVKTFGKAAGA